MTASMQFVVRPCESRTEQLLCQQLIAEIYHRRYRVTFSDDMADPTRSIEPYPTRYIMGLLDGRLVATVGLYLRDSYIERFGNVADEEIQALLDDAEASDRYSCRRKREYSKLVIKSELASLGLSRLFIAVTHSRDFLQCESDTPHIILNCARLSIFRHTVDAIGIRTRPIKPFPSYRSHDLYRSERDPMESRLIIPDIDIPSKWYNLRLPVVFDVDLTEQKRSTVMSMGTEYGNYDPGAVEHPALAELTVRVAPLDLVSQWRRCGLTADFLAGFLSYNFQHRDQALIAISTVINELIENAVKFSADQTRPITLTLAHYGDSVCIDVTNSVDQARAATFSEFLIRLLAEDGEDLFLRQIEHGVTAEEPVAGLGLITLKKDHQAKIGVRIIPNQESGLFDAIVRVTLNTEEVDRK